MKSTKAHHEDEEDDYEEFGGKKDAPPPNSNKDGKSSDKANATRSKHSVTEQRRRSKINERFQILRDLIPNSDQKRDTASFLLEVIEYVQYLQEKVQKYEGSYQGWSPEPSKLMPWRNSHWRVPNFVGHPQALKNDACPVSSFPARFDDKNVANTPTMQAHLQNPTESDPSGDASCKVMDQQPELINKTVVMPMPVQAGMPVPIQQGDVAFSHPTLRGPLCDAQATECPVSSDVNQQEDLTIEGGTISISSAYSQGLLNTLTQALQNAGVDLAHATISVQIDLGKRANRGPTPGVSIAKDNENPHSSHQPVGQFQGASNGEDTIQAQKRMKISQ